MKRDATEISKVIPIPLYGGRVTVHVTRDFEHTLSQVNYEGDLECDACCIYDLSGGANYDLIFKHGRVQHGLIAHEVFHLTMRIMQHINKPYDVNNDEPEAYLNQHITGEIYAFMKQNKVKILR